MKHKRIYEQLYYLITKFLAKLFIKLNIVPGDNIYIAHASNLIGPYVGSTENRTQKIVDKAKNYGWGSNYSNIK